MVKAAAAPVVFAVAVAAAVPAGEGVGGAHLPLGSSG